MEQLKNEVIVQLRNVGGFTTEMLMMIDQAISSVLRNYQVTRMCTDLIVQATKYCKELEDFLLRKEFRGCSEQTLKQYRYLLNAYVAWLDKDVKAANADDIRKFLNDYAKINNISDRTKDSKRLIIRSFYTFLNQNGYIGDNPSIAVEPIKYKQKVREPLTPMEIEQMRMACSSEFEEALFELFFSTGCRVSEVANMKISDVDFEHDKIVVCGKGNKERIVLMTPRAHLALKVYLNGRSDGNEGLFISEHGKKKPLGKCSLENRIKTLGEKSGIGRTITPHVLRHTCCTVLCLKCPIEVVSQLMGHSKLETTKIYCHNSEDKLKQHFIAAMI